MADLGSHVSDYSHHNVNEEPSEIAADSPHAQLNQFLLWEVGKPGSPFYRAYLLDGNGNELSSMHDIPLEADSEDFILNFVCTTPAGAATRLQLSISENYHPLCVSQHSNTTDCSHCSEVVPGNHGLFPQTWGDLQGLELAQGGLGTNKKYPLEVIDIGARKVLPGDVYPVKPLAAFLVLDKQGVEPQLSWKVIAVDSTDPLAEKLTDISQLKNYLPVTYESICICVQNFVYQSKDDEVLSTAATTLPVSYEETIAIISKARNCWRSLVSDMVIPEQFQTNNSFSSLVHEVIDPNDPSALLRSLSLGSQHGSDYQQISESVYDQAWAAEVDTRRRERDMLDKESAERRSQSMKLTSAERKGLAALQNPVKKNATLSMKESSNKSQWFRKTISSFVGLKSLDRDPDCSTSVDGTEKILSSRNLKGLFKPIALKEVSIPVSILKSQSGVQDQENVKPNGKKTWGRKSRVMVQFTEAPQLTRQSTMDRRSLTRMDTMPAPDVHRRAAEEFRSSLSVGDEHPSHAGHGRYHSRHQSMEGMMEQISTTSYLASLDRAGGDRAVQDAEQLLIKSFPREMSDCSQESLQKEGAVSHSGKEAESVSAEELKASLWTDEKLGGEADEKASTRGGKAQINRSFSGPFVVSGAAIHPIKYADTISSRSVSEIPKVDSGSGEDETFPEYPHLSFAKPPLAKRSSWNPKGPRVYKAVQGSGFPAKLSA